MRALAWAENARMTMRFRRRFDGAAAIGQDDDRALGIEKAVM